MRNGLELGIARSPIAARRISGACLWALLGLAACGPGPDPYPVLGAALSTDYLNSLRLALAEEVLEEGPHPRRDTLLIPQGSNRALQALGAAHELAAASGMVAVIGHANSSASLASSQVYNRTGIVQIAPTSTAPLYSEAGPFSFRMVPSDAVQGRFLAEVVAAMLPDGGRLALLFVNDDYGRSLRETFLEALDQSEIRQVLDLPHTEGDVEALDVSHHLTALEAERPDLLVWLGRVPGLAALLPGIRDRLGDVAVLGSDAVARAEFLSNRGPEWAGVRFSDFLDMEATPELRDLQERFLERFGTDAGTGEALTYDAARLLLSGLREGVRTGEEMRKHLMTFGRERPAFAGLTGPIGFDDRGDVDRTFVMRTIEARPGR